MTFSSEFLEKYKTFKNIDRYNDLAVYFPELNSGNISSIKNGKRSLTANQVIAMAEEMGVDWKEALISLSIEKTKDKELKDRWSEIKKKITAACVAVAMTIASAAVMTNTVPPLRYRR
ncbi:MULTISPECIES: hypothetical protein [Pseudoalteromonas]|uniref:HTH cro/C1-type domain-containing protein n=1 Tax=Pseudoalteromonas lipolytica TaxID=570156 RepID=A0ABY1GWK4_9GAMM|nr:MULTISPECIES: hypothetical protein [Pseudoalteromonas]MBE0349282.1 hypothetical protein [Pseudoalteromonas lipolytica LMEB 39]TMP19878.1 hypothetical protein CWC02_06915 [Pseudoalteromonas sp. S2721]SFU03158.1 hypothetical protein SAMN04487854_1371 [Pseudoalteromonas lipolytica]